MPEFLPLLHVLSLPQQMGAGQARGGSLVSFRPLSCLAQEEEFAALPCASQKLRFCCSQCPMDPLCLQSPQILPSSQEPRTVCFPESENDALNLRSSLFQLVPFLARTKTSAKEGNKQLWRVFGSQALNFIALPSRKVNDKSQGRTLLIGFKMRFSPFYSTLGSRCLNSYALFG